MGLNILETLGGNIILERRLFEGLVLYFDKS